MSEQQSIEERLGLRLRNAPFVSVDADTTNELIQECRKLYDALEVAESIIVSLATALVECFDAAIPQAMPWIGTELEKAAYAAKMLPNHLAGLNRLSQSKELQIEAAEKRVAELEADKKRLDWLSQRKYVCYGSHPLFLGDASIHIQTDGFAARGFNLRTAIDAAMEVE